MFEFLKKKQKSVLSEEDTAELREIERKAYMDSARKLVELRGQDRAKQELRVKREDF